MEFKTINRQKLYEQVWSTPMTLLAKEYGMSDNGLRKVCDRMNIPMPKIGYWQKIHSGLNVQRVPLPDAEGISEIRVKLKDESEQIVEVESPQILAESLPENKITVSDVLTDPHKLIVSLKKDLKTRNKKVFEHGLLYSSFKELCVSIGPESIDRALLIFDALIKAFEKRGLKVSVKEDEQGRATLVDVDGEKIAFDLHEKYNVIKTGKLDTFGTEIKEYKPSGVLSLRIDDGYWNDDICKDKKRKRLEEQLNDFIVAIYREAEKRKRQRIQREQEHLEYVRKQQRLEDLSQKQEVENQKLQKLVNNALSWHKSQIVRSFLDALKKQQGEVKEGSEFEQWLAWAYQQADRLDPIKRGFTTARVGEKGSERDDVHPE